jgi:hypothetical protein
MLAVRSNVQHRLSLSLADRKQATVQIMRSHPNWSDRVVASKSWLTPKTVGAIRRRSAEEVAHPNSRIGRDGRVRPADASARCLLARRFLTDKADPSVREIARAVGIAPSTMHRIRQSMKCRRRRAGVRLLRRRRAACAVRVGVAAGRSGVRRGPRERAGGAEEGPFGALQRSGPSLIRLLGAGPVTEDEWACLVDDVPGSLRRSRRRAREAA